MHGFGIDSDVDVLRVRLRERHLPPPIITSKVELDLLEEQARRKTLSTVCYLTSVMPLKHSKWVCHLPERPSDPVSKFGQPHRDRRLIRVSGPVDIGPVASTTTSNVLKRTATSASSHGRSIHQLLATLERVVADGIQRCLW